MWRWRLLGIGLLMAASAFILESLQAGDAWRPHRVNARPAGLDPDWIAVQQMLNSKCRTCHRTGKYVLDFSSHQGLLSAHTQMGDSLVTPGSVEESALFRSVHWEPPGCTGNPSGPVMKPSMPPEEEEWLTAGQIALLVRWIERGAPEFSADIPAQALTPLDFPSARECKTCHPTQYAQWSRSMHAYAQKSPVFEAFYLTMAERTHGTVGVFCTRCHTPVGTALGESGQLHNVHRSRLSMEGITCVACHRRSHAQGRVSGELAIQAGDIDAACLYGPFDDPLLGEDQRHPAAGNSFLRTSMFCGSCHDVTNPQGMRLEEAFSEWRNSPAAKKGVTCQHCHMGPNPGVPVEPCDRPMGYAAVMPGVELKMRPLTDHTFAGPDYSLLPDTEFPEKLDWMYEIDYTREHLLSEYHQRTLSSLRERNQQSLAQATALRHQLLKNAAKLTVVGPDTVTSGRRASIKVSVTSLFEGHNFPTGFTEERQAWVEVTVVDQDGKVLYCSGDLDGNGDLRNAGSHAVLTGEVPYDRDLMNFQSQFIVLSERGTERPVTIPVNRDVMSVNILRPSTETATALGRPTALRVQKSSLPPLATRSRTYKFRVPHNCKHGYYTVRLLYRHLPPHLLDEIGVPHLKPQLEVVVVDEVSGEFSTASSAWRILSVGEAK